MFERLKNDFIEFMLEMKKEQLKSHALASTAMNDNNNNLNVGDTGDDDDDDLFGGLTENVVIDAGDTTVQSDVELRIQCESELKLFMTVNGMPLKDPNNSKAYNDCLTWWSENDHRYPIIAPLAKLFLAIPASSAPSERVWSRAARVITIRRARMKQDVAASIMFLRENIHLLDKHYDEVSKTVVGALPREFSGLSLCNMVTDKEGEVDVGGELFPDEF